MKKFLIGLFLGIFFIATPVYAVSTLFVPQGGTGLQYPTTGFQLNRFLIGNGQSAIATSSNLIWDNTNFRLGIGTSSPYAKLSVVGEVVASSFTGTTTAASTFAGNVGINTLVPLDPLAVTGNISALGNGSKIYNGAANDTAGLYFLNDSVSLAGYSDVIIRASATNLSSQTERLRVLASNGNVGIASSSPYQGLSVAATAVFTSTTTFTKGLLVGSTTRIDGLDISNPITSLGNFETNRDGRNLITIGAHGNSSVNSTPGVNAYQSRGTNGNPSASQTDDTVYFMGGRGYGSTGYGVGSKVAISMNLSQNWTDTNQGTYITLETTADNSTTRLERVRINQAGNVGIGSSTPFATLAVNPIAGQASNQFVVGSSSATNFKIDNSGNIFAPNTLSSGSAQTGYWCYDSNGQMIRDSVVCIVSALKFKKDVTPIDSGIEELMKLRPVNYYLKEPLGENDKVQQLGFIADEAMKVDPRLVTFDSKGEIHGFRYEQFTALITKSVQDTWNSLQYLTAKVTGLEKRLNDQEKRIKLLEDKLK